MDKLFQTDGKGYLKKRESFDLEYKQNFQLGDNLLKYIKSLVGMANNKGGKIIFGVQDSPRIPKGMTNNRFDETDPKDIDKTIREYFSQELIWKSEMYRVGENNFGILTVEEAENKPVICKKNKDGVLREGAVYYRYRGETKEIEYPELQKVLDKEKEKEKLLWLKHITQISTIGPKNVQLLDTYKGEITTGEGRILIDKNILDKINFVQEGKFVEKEGTPTLKLVGEISGVVDAENMLPNDKVYPLFTKVN
ncbi:MAG: ATP-binding protein [Dysgonamonadaceae bacterium]|jgi:predicted HTH transcriptional regulator|nr:ATP-binding protein [Dysgonamonadaceae bacterium]